jgi:hypothetical protein
MHIHHIELIPQPFWQLECKFHRRKYNREMTRSLSATDDLTREATSGTISRALSTNVLAVVPSAETFEAWARLVAQDEDLGGLRRANASEWSVQSKLGAR